MVSEITGKTLFATKNILESGLNVPKWCTIKPRRRDARLGWGDISPDGRKYGVGIAGWLGYIGWERGWRCSEQDALCFYLVGGIVACVVSFWVGFDFVGEGFHHLSPFGLRPQEVEIAVLPAPFPKIDVFLSVFLSEAFDSWLVVFSLVGASNGIPDGGVVHILHSPHHIVLELGG